MITRSLAPILFTALCLISSSADAVLISNSSTKSTLPDEDEEQVSENSSEAVALLSEGITQIEKENSMDAGAEQFSKARELFESVIKILESFIPSAKTEPVPLGEVPAPEGVSQEQIDAGGVPPQQMLTFFLSFFPNETPSEKEVLEFLRDETQRAKASVDLMLVGVEQKDPGTIRIGLFALPRFIARASAYSLFWSVAEGQS